MLTHIHPKLPMRNKEITKAYYVEDLGFEMKGGDYPDYIMVSKDEIEIHFFAFPELDPMHNYGQVYIRVENIRELYNSFLEKGVEIHPNGPLSEKPWGQREFSLLDPDHNLITFGEEMGF